MKLYLTNTFSLILNLIPYAMSIPTDWITDNEGPSYYKITDRKLVKFPYDQNETIDLDDFMESQSRKKSLLPDAEILSVESKSLEQDKEDNVINLISKDVNEEFLERNQWMAQYTLFGGSQSRITLDGANIVNGDTVVSSTDEYTANDDDLSGRKATTNLIVIWPYRRVVYSFHPSVFRKPNLRKIIEEAIDHWRENTCLSFEKRNLDHFPFWYLNFRHDKERCYSSVGNVVFTMRGQDVSIGKGCEYRDTVIREIGHAIGFFNEQSRKDRDDFVVLLTQNVKPENLHELSKSNTRSFGIPYDYQSVMHYDNWIYSIRPYEKNTLVTKNPHDQRLLGKYDGLSFRDRKMANTLYSCDDKCTNKSSIVCQNEGYLRPLRDQPENCTCDCPNGTSGDFCENIDSDYNTGPVCGGNVTEPEVIETPNYPVRKEPHEDCSWWIQAPPGQRVQVTFIDFDFDRRLSLKDHPMDGLCVLERVEIRREDRFNGDMYCAQDIPPGEVMTSKENEFVILIMANEYKIGRGLKANVTFV